MPAPTIALVTPDLTVAGGTKSVTRFLHNVIAGSGRYETLVVSLATSSRDRNSIGLFRPHTWGRGITASREMIEGMNVVHVGASLVELEFRRYARRRELSRLLSDVDLIQVVAGGPAWCLPFRNASSPVLLQVATLASLERARKRSGLTPSRRLLLDAMTALTGRLEKKALRVPIVTFVENRRMFQWVREQTDGAHVLFSPPGVDVSWFHPAKVPSENRYILSVGRFDDPRKNAALTFRAYRRLLDLAPEAPPLKLVGRSPGQRDLHLANSLGLSGRFSILERVTDDELAALYRQAIAYLQTSEEEGLGMAVLEAMASGLAVVGTRCGGLEETIVDGETGFLRDVNDSVGIAQALDLLIRDPKRRTKMGAAGRRRVERDFSLETRGADFLAVYDALLGAGAPGREQ